MSKVDTKADDAGPVPAPRGGARSKAARMPRAMQERRASQRRGIGGDYRGRLHLDPAMLDPGKEYTWIRELAAGERDEGNIQDALDIKGYEPVLSDDAPHLAGRMLPGQERTDKLIRRGGLVLMARPKEVAQQDRMAIVRDTRDQMASVTRAVEDARDQGNPEYLRALPGEGVSVEVDRGMAPRGGRYEDAGE